MASQCFYLSTLCNILFLQAERFQPGLPADFPHSKAQTSAQRSPPSSFSSLSSFSPVLKQRPAAADQLLATQADGDLLLAALRQYLSGHLSLHRGEEQGGPSPRLRPFYGNGIENSGLKKETAKARPLMVERLPGASAKDPLTSVDGTCSKLQRDGFYHQRMFVVTRRASPQIRQEVPHIPTRPPSLSAEQLGATLVHLQFVSSCFIVSP